ncbi:MAG: hypothetical protein ABIG32_00415 [Candidatus Uhrbacteria bacterium]
MTRLSDSELILYHGELVRRRNLPSNNPEHLSSEWVRAFFEGKLVLREDIAKGLVIALKPYIEAMISAGLHKYAIAPDGTEGMKPKDYRKLWPMSVVQPLEYAGRFDLVLLVDRTIPNDRLFACGKFHQPEPVESVFTTAGGYLIDEVAPPTSSSGWPLRRYVAFVRYVRNQNQSGEDSYAKAEPDEVGLVTVEGLHTLVEHLSILHGHNCVWPGSIGTTEYRQYSKPGLCWPDGRPALQDSGASDEYSAFRGRKVTAVD